MQEDVTEYKRCLLNSRKGKASWLDHYELDEETSTPIILYYCIFMTFLWRDEKFCKLSSSSYVL